MNKSKYILIISAVVLLGILSALFFFVSRINFYGEYQISYKKNTNNGADQIFLECVTPTNRKIVIPFRSDKTIVSGFFKNIFFIYPCHCDSLRITAENNISQIAYTPNLPCTHDKKIFELKTLNDTSFQKKLIAFIVWVFNIDFVKILLFICVFILVIFASYLLYKKANHNYSKSQRNIVAQTLFILISFILWVFIIFVLLELSLRVFGTYYRTKQDNISQGDKNFTVLCIGDSFTYGIGAKQGKSYPEQLEEIIEKEEKMPVRVINAGICAGNTFQILEQIQALLKSYKPDVVIMLFGMANSWNYYGFSEEETFLNSFKTYKLILRIIENIKYKESGFEMHQRAEEFSTTLFNKTWHAFIENRKAFETAYHGGRYFLSLKKWQDALKCFSYASSLCPLNDSTRNGLWISTEKMDYDLFYNNYQFNDIRLTLMPEIIQTIDTLISNYPESVDLNIIKYRYYAVKGDTTTAIKLLDSLIAEYPDNFVLYHDMEKLLTAEELEDFFECENNVLKTNSFKTANGYFYLKKNKPLLARIYFEEVLNKDKDDGIAALGINIINLKNNSDVITAKDNKFFLLMQIQKAVYNIIYKKKENQIEHQEVQKYSHHFKNKLIDDLEKNLEKSDSVYYVNSATIMTSLLEIVHEDFFLYHYNKRSKSIKDEDVLKWIENDINNITDICIKQGFKIICMNYPIIPPPNSEETSFWAVQAGFIWEHLSRQKNIPFINQDSIFDLLGDQKISLFEPRFTGTEHCNEKGYELMAWNIYKCMLKNKMFEK